MSSDTLPAVEQLALATDEVPVAWRCHWHCTAGSKPFDKQFRPVSQQLDFRTHNEAVRHKAQLRATYGGHIAVSVTPVFRTRQERERRFKRLQLSLGDDWPLQTRTTR
jgi:hypothetical protein